MGTEILYTTEYYRQLQEQSFLVIDVIYSSERSLVQKHIFECACTWCEEKIESFYEELDQVFNYFPQYRTTNSVTRFLMKSWEERIF